MCLSPKAPSLPAPVVAPVTEQATPTFGSANQTLNADKNKRAKRKGSSGFKIDLQTADTSSGLSIGKT